jgi:hypothetical protein
LSNIFSFNMVDGFQQLRHGCRGLGLGTPVALQCRPKSLSQATFQQPAKPRSGEREKGNPQVAAWTSVCQMLFGTAEFRYLY